MRLSKINWALLNPLLIPAWLGLGMLWVITRFPSQWQFKLGKGLGYVLYLFPSELKSITRINLKLCYPHLSEKEQQQLAKKSFASVGLGIVEAAMAWWIPDKKLTSLYQLHGIDNVTKAFAKGKGILLVAPHSTCIEMVGRLLGMRYTFGVMYTPHKKPFIQFIHDRFRKKHYVNYIPRQKIRQLLRSLQNNMAIWYAYDIDGGRKRSLFAPFFGIPTASLTAVSRLLDLSGATVVPVRYYRNDHKFSYDVFLDPPLENFPTDDPVADLTYLNSLLENAIRKKPEQYVWQYKRFKTRPKGDKRFY